MSRITKANVKNNVYVESDERIDLGSIYDVIDAIIQSYDEENSTKKQAIHGIMNLWMDELQGYSEGNVMPQTRNTDRISAEELL